MEGEQGRRGSEHVRRHLPPTSLSVKQRQLLEPGLASMGFRAGHPVAHRAALGSLPPQLYLQVRMSEFPVIFMHHKIFFFGFFPNYFKM